MLSLITNCDMGNTQATLVVAMQNLSYSFYADISSSIFTDPLENRDE